jgi:putative spermidine/putrescine transport system permease protein
MNRTGMISGAVQVVGAVVLAFLILPILAVIPASFNQSSFIKIPPESLSLRWYQQLFNDAGWASAITTSIEVALLATLFSIVLGTLAALGMERLRPTARKLLSGLILAPLIVPVIMTSIALYYAMRRTGLHGSLTGLALGHTILCLPFVVLNVGVSLNGLDPSWARAAAGLGAAPLHIFRTITLPAIKPGLASGGAFAFITSFDEVVISIFLASANAKTLPVKLWEQMRVEFTPVAAAGSAVILAMTVVIFVFAQLVRSRGVKPA